MKGLRLYKKEKLCSKKAIDALFTSDRADVDSALAFPLRVVWRMNAQRAADCPQFVIVVPKRRIRHAVDRVTLRRRVREAYRLSRNILPSDIRIDISFIYVADKITSYHRIERSMTKLLARIGASLSVS